MARTGQGFESRALAEAVAAWQATGAALADPTLMAAVDRAGETVLGALDNGRSLFVAGNGGSAAMSSHVAAEFAGKCVRDREPLPAISLAESSTAMTAIGNDYGFDQVFTRGIRALGRPGDVLLAMTTSGSSPNIRAALMVARERGMVTILMTGLKGAGLTEVADHLLVAPSDSTPRIQEVHLLWSHSWCEAVDHAWNDAH